MSNEKVYHRGARSCPISRDDWATPQPLFDLLDREFHFTLDVCADATNATCQRYFAPLSAAPGWRGEVLAYDGLVQSWQGERCFMNPPFSTVKQWIAKAAAECAPDNNCLVVALVASRTDTIFWHDYVMPYAAEVRFLKGRVKFVGAKHGAPFPSAVVVFRRPHLRMVTRRPIVSSLVLSAYERGHKPSPEVPR